MSKKRMGYMLLGIGIALAFIVGVVVYGRVSEANRVIASLPTERVVVASRDIPARAEIAAAMVTVVTMTDEAVPPGAATSVEEVVGTFTPNEILSGEVINTTRIGPAAARNAPSFQVERGKVMYAMPLQLPGQEPFSILQVNALRPGDRVDFIYTTLTLPEGLNEQEIQAARAANPAQFLQTRFMLQDIRIQQIGTFDETGAIVEGSSYMIMVVSPEEALVLKWLKDAAESFGNSIEMVLRAPGDEEQVDPSLTVNLAYMRDKYGLPAPPRLVPADQ